MVDVLIVVSLLCYTNVCTYDNGAKIPTITKQVCSISRPTFDAFMDLDGKTFLYLIRMPCKKEAE